jgi:probable rRNA maturation factor
MKTQIKITILKSCKKWNELKEINKKYMNLILRTVLSSHSNFDSVELVELSILFTDNSEISKLNQQHRNKNSPTNILSFPDTDELIYNKNDLDKELYLGDLALSYEQIMTESLESNISFYNHFTHLLIHGILHLLGYDHHNNEDAIKMESLEVKLLETLNITTPY